MGISRTRAPKRYPLYTFSRLYGPLLEPLETSTLSVLGTDFPLGSSLGNLNTHRNRLTLSLTEMSNAEVRNSNNIPPDIKVSKGKHFENLRKEFLIKNYTFAFYIYVLRDWLVQQL